MRIIGDPVSAAVLIIAASILGVSFQAPELTPFSWVGLAAIAVLIRRRECKLVPAYVAGVTFQMVGVFWMTSTYSSLDLTESRISNWVLLGLYFGVIFPVVLSLGSRLRAHWPMWLVMPVIWTAGDLLRFEGGRLIGGTYPWLVLGYSQTGFITGCQVADLGGMWAVGFLAAMFGGTIGDVIHYRRVPIVPTILIVASLGYGATRICTSEFSVGPSLALMPGRNTDVPQADLALWPEAAFYGHEPLSAPCPTVQGCLREDGEKTFNSAMIDIQGITICYDKCNVVPYSEANITAGTSIVSFESGGYQIGVAICYDICFHGFMRQLSDCNLILVPANEASDPTMSLAGQLLAMSRLRAIEMRRAVVRNANGGYSGAIDGNGVLRPIGLDFREPIVLGPVPIDNRFSLYVYFGDWLPIACILAVLVAVGRGSCLQSVPRVAGNVVKDESHSPVA